MTEMTRERLLECRNNLRRAHASGDADADPPQFIDDMNHQELIQWDIQLYELALEGLEMRGPWCSGQRRPKSSERT